MLNRPRSLPVLALALFGLLGAWPVLALELVPGGYGRAPVDPGAAVSVPDERLAIGGSSDPAGMSLGFTPRHGAGGVVGPGADPGPRFGLAVGEFGGALERLGILGAPDSVRPAGRGSAGAGLTVGGAMQWHEWTVGGGLGQADFLGTELDLVAASLGYGRISAEVAYGQGGGHATEPSDVLMLSTDLAAAPWLTLESDLALGSRPDVDREDRSVAVGRFGLRLNF